MVPDRDLRAWHGRSVTSLSKICTEMADTTGILGDYVISSQLSDEYTTAIFEACNRNTGEVLVIKYPKPGCTQIACELGVLSEISHPNIIKLRDAIQTPNGPAIVLPLARGGDLFGWIEAGGFPERHVKHIIFRILSALSCLHARNLWHRDVKPENILVMADTFSPDVVVLSDFGYCRRFDDGVTREDYCGSPHYSAPELYRQQPYTAKVDIWALGITMYTLLTGRMPFNGNNYEAMVREILRGLPDLLETDELLFVSDPCRELLDWMLSPEAENRPSADQALKHPWFEELDDAKPTEAAVGVKDRLFEEFVSA